MGEQWLVSFCVLGISKLNVVVVCKEEEDYYPLRSRAPLAVAGPNDPFAFFPSHSIFSGFLSGDH